MDDQLKEKGSAPPPGRHGVSLTARVGLIVLASVALAAVFLTVALNLLAQHENAAAVMNVAGRQRMLTQRMVKEALLIASSGDEQARYNLPRWRQEFSANLEALRQGDPARGIPRPPQEIRDHLAHIAQDWETFATALDTVDGSPTRSSAQQEALSLVMAGETHLLEHVDAVVSLYEEVSVGHERTFGLYLILYALGGGLIALLGLLFASLGVARPLVRLARTMEAVGLGRPLQLRQQDLRRGDEIGVLSREFESTTTAIMEREKELLESNHRLGEALAELHRTQQQIIQQQRLRALGEMASGIAHDFNSALTPILGYTDLLLSRPEDLDDREQVLEYLKTMNTAARDAANMVRRLREFYRYRDETESLQPVNLSQLVEQAVSLTEPRWRSQALSRGITISIETDLPEVPPVAGSESELRSALTNLIFNAVDAMPQGGTITFRTYPDGEHVVLEVSDTGIGMTEEVRQRCLEPFFTTKSESGTGLGLATVYGTVQRHEGTIHIESEVGKGTTFTIRLPAQAREKAESGGQQEAKAPAQPLRILVVDDDPVVRQVIARYLIGDGHTVETAVNGAEGLEKFRTGSFDLVMTDGAMPVMSGYQLAAALKQASPNKPLIMLSGFGDATRLSGEKPAGVDLVLSKPVTLEELRQALARVAPQT